MVIQLFVVLWIGRKSIEKQETSTFFFQLLATERKVLARTFYHFLKAVPKRERKVTEVMVA
jgi:hypothetical protein